MKWALLCATASVMAAMAAAPAQRTFETPKEAARALVKALGDDDVKKLGTIFGPEGRDIVDSGDPDQDRENRAQLARLAAEKLQIRQSDADRAFVLLGNGERPFPVPLIRSNGRWRFDSAAGNAALNAQRIRDNEDSAIEVCHGYVAAQAEYRNLKGRGHYAKNLKDLATEDPFPKTFTRAVADMFAGGKQVPYRGYRFRILPSQAPEDGGETADFAMVAYPARYGVTGVRSFIVDRQDIVYGRDLGPKTSQVAQAMRRFDAGQDWVPARR